MQPQAFLSRPGIRNFMHMERTDIPRLELETFAQVSFKIPFSQWNSIP